MGGGSDIGRFYFVHMSVSGDFIIHITNGAETPVKVPLYKINEYLEKLLSPSRVNNKQLKPL